VVVLTCPQCASQSTFEPSEGSPSCPACGRALSLDDTVLDTRDAEAERSMVNKLRQAFHDASSSSSILVRQANGVSGAVEGVTEAPALACGSRLGEFEIVEELGRGGMGVVYRARQSTLDREVALKVLPANRRTSASAIRRFRTEAQAAARLHHENVVPIYAQGECDGQIFFSMELVDGISLDTAIRSRPELLSSTFRWDSSAKSRSKTPWPSGSASASANGGGRLEESAPEPSSMDIHWSREDFRHIARLATGAADGLAHAHERGVVHRDIKPHNILLGSDNRLHITDFGLAYLTSEPHVTVSGEIMGTPAYLSPEQIRGEVGSIDHRTDVYSFGVTLYELLTRRRPFDGETRDQLLHSICHDEPRPPRKWDASIPVDLETICLRAIEKEPGRRHASAALLAEDLRRFAEGRPILSRRTGPLEKAAKWVRRHKAASTAIAAALAVVFLGAGLATSRAASRRNEAASLLDRAYRKLAHYNYANPEAVADDLARAEQLGAEPIKLGITKTLVHLGEQDWNAAIEEAQGVRTLDPLNDQAMYLIAWAHAESKNHVGARATVEEADRLVGPQSAESWFFRGFAVHHDRPTEAIDSYREAIRLRVEQEDLYQQANLHLARAYNQKLYVERKFEDFSEVKAKLEQLIEHNYRGGYPYYLLSIGHRLVGEFYDGTGGSGEKNAEDHFQQSLGTARAGQEVDPGDNRPVTAEAECLESMGLFQEAIEARTRALALAEFDSHRCEQYHYRWRLYYWTGAYDAALADITRHRECLPESPFYRHVYPALVLAEAGDRVPALEELRVLAAEAPDDAQTILTAASWMRILGWLEEADSLLAVSAAQVRYNGALEPGQTPEWIETLYLFCSGSGSMEPLAEMAAASETPWKLDAELHFHAAALALSNGDRRAALDHFNTSYRSFDSQQRYTFHSKLILERMRADPSWPLWWTANDHAAAPTRGDWNR